jgi:hypothetical protein
MNDAMTQRDLLFLLCGAVLATLPWSLCSIATILRYYFFDIDRRTREERRKADHE